MPSMKLLSYTKLVFDDDCQRADAYLRSILDISSFGNQLVDDRSDISTEICTQSVQLIISSSHNDFE